MSGVSRRFFVSFLFFKVDSRPTARVPIVMFKDGESGLQCNISVMNPLALRNTRLLKVTERVDYARAGNEGRGSWMT